MKRLISAVLALTLLGGTAATAAPFHPGPFGPPGWARHDVVRYAPHRWVRGERFYMPASRYVVVNDWYRFHLRRPPYGYHWVRYGDDFLLVAFTTGLIADVMYGPFWN